MEIAVALDRPSRKVTASDRGLDSEPGFVGKLAKPEDSWARHDSGRTPEKRREVHFDRA